MSKTRPSNLFIILILGALTTITPFSIDMYLPAFQQIADEFNTTAAQISLSLSSYFVGMALGQIIYGPMLDRFGRKKPLFIGLAIYVAASICCIFAKDVEQLAILRFAQALGGSVAGVASMAMVRDFFPVEDTAKIISLLILVLGVSPLFAPTVGGFVTAHLGWHWVFIILSVITLIIGVVTWLYLPEGHKPDPTISLKPRPIITGFLEILTVPQFITYAFSGALAFSGLLVYVSGSPIIFMNGFHVSPQLYGGIFALLATGFIGSNQVNIFLNKKYSSEKIYKTALGTQCVLAAIFFTGTLFNLYGLVATIILLFMCLSTLGLTYPNASALALAPFTKNIGSASALLGFLQIGIGSLASTGISMFDSKDSYPVIMILAGTSWAGFAILLIGRRFIKTEAEPTPEELLLLH